MRRILTVIILLVATYTAIAATPSTDRIALTTGGSRTIIATASTQQFIVTGTVTLSTDQSFIVSGTPLTGTSFVLWFNNTNVTPNGHKVFILSQDYTATLTGSVNLFINLSYNGSAWTVSSTEYKLTTALASYVKSTTLTDSLSRYTRSADLTTTLAGYASLSGATFVGYVLSPIPSNSDSSTKLSATAFVKRNIQIGLTGYATSASVTSAISTATTSITSAYTSAISTAVAANSRYTNVSSWAAGTINISDWSTSVYNTIRPNAVTGNIVLTAVVYAGNNSEITIILPFSGSYTVTAGANMDFDTVTGANTHKSVLTLVWDVVSSTYILKSFSQN